MRMRWINGWLYYTISTSGSYYLYAINTLLQNPPGTLLYSDNSDILIEKRGNYLYYRTSNVSGNVSLTPNYYNNVLNGLNNATYPGFIQTISYTIPNITLYLGQYISDEYFMVVGIQNANNGLLTNYLITRPSVYMNDLEINGTLNVNGEAYKVTSPAWIVPSDKRLKKNITELDGKNSLNKICALKLSEWEWNHKKDIRHRGPTAQDLQEVYPEYVKEVSSKVFGENLGLDKVLTIDTGELLFEAIASIQELYKRVVFLEKSKK
jgi:hypothetical protein